MAAVKLKILFLEDELALAEIVKETLEMKGYEVQHATTCQGVLIFLKKNKVDMLILDVMVPDGDGFSLLRKLRHEGIQTPAIFLTSKSLPKDVVEGFESGGSDYLKKPFSMEELSVRIRSLLGQLNTVEETLVRTKQEMSIGEYTFHYPEGILVYQGIAHKLTFKEAEVLNMLAQSRGKIIARKEMLVKYWGKDDYFTGRSLDVFVTKLRKYLKADPTIMILNFRGQGYKLIC